MSDKKYKELGDHSWEYLVMAGIEKLLNGLGLKDEHVQKTPERFVGALHEYTSGYMADPGPQSILETSFEEKEYNQMLFVNDISFVSNCKHHLVPFAGKIHFGYIPDGKIVGLSKIPRMIDCFSHRFQTQEQLSEQIANTFFEVVKPLGCGVVIEAVHFCICSRGVKKTGSYTKTQALRGNFMHDSTKQEFLASAKRLEGSLL